MSFKQRLKQNLINIPGWRTRRKIVVFESDDWGAIRMPSPEVYQRLVGKGMGVESSRYDTYDSLEKKQDIEALTDILNKVTDSRGNTGVFTTNMVMGNPDFEKIKDAGFQEFHHEYFLDSYQKLYGQNLEILWTKSIKEKLLFPQFHAREHLNVPLWMKDLRAGHKVTRLAFQHGFYGLKTKTSSPYQTNYLAAYRAEDTKERSTIVAHIKKGLKLFEQAFGFQSKTFIACNYVWPQELEELLLPEDVKVFQGQRAQLDPRIKEGGKLKIRRKYTGQKNSHGQLFTVRNVRFEPYLRTAAEEEVDSALAEIKRSFLWRKPAIISSHRINYVSQMSMKHRDNNLFALRELLSRLVKTYPDIEFMHSDALHTVMNSR